MGRRQGFGLTLSILATLMAVTACAQLPYRFIPSWLSSQRQNYSALWPQGWAFFASQPDSPAVSAYRIAGDKAPIPELAAQASSGNLWGIGQSSSAYFIEATYLASMIPSRDWTRCGDPVPSRCLPTSANVRLDDPFVPPLLCGETLFVKYFPQDAAGTGRPAIRLTVAAEAQVSCS